MAPKIIAKGALMAKMIVYIVSFVGKLAGQALVKTLKAPFTKTITLPPDFDTSKMLNIVVVGASFAGYQAASAIASRLPADSLYRVVVIEPHSHFHFTWVLPRFCVVNHEEKAFIPYGGLLKGVPEHRLKWVQDRVANITKDSVRLQDSGVDVAYEFLVIATGSGATDGLPSRVGSNDKTSGIELLRKFQNNIAKAEKIVVVGGGAAGVELATDAKEKYPAKSITLIHSRDAVMHRFGPELQQTAKKGIEDLGINLILGQRATQSETGSVTLSSGLKIECDLLINCGGQKAGSGILAMLSPSSIDPTSGKIAVKETLQIKDDNLPNVFVCGDVADSGVKNPNARFAYAQALLAASNVVLAAQGKAPSNKYTQFWGDGVIKLTLGITKSVSHISDGHTELIFSGKEKEEELMAKRAWLQLGAVPYNDPSPSGPSMVCTPEEVIALSTTRADIAVNKSPASLVSGKEEIA